MESWSELSTMEPRTLEIRTKCIEQTLIPLVTQITTLVNAKEKPMKSEKTLQAIFHVGQNVNRALQRFVSVGEAIAYDNRDIRQDLSEACKDARAAGDMIEQLCDIPSGDFGKLKLHTEKNEMDRAAKTLLSSVTRVLLLADTVVVKQLESARDKVCISLNNLENAAGFTEFVKAFSQFGNDMVELAHLTGDRQNDLKDELRCSEMAVARQILERSTMLLLTTSKVCYRYPESEFTHQNKDIMFSHMRKALDLVHFVIKDGIIAEMSNKVEGLKSESIHNRNSVLWSIEDLDQCNTVYDGIKRFENIVQVIRMTLVGAQYRERLTESFSTVTERTQDFTDSAYMSHTHRENILLLCDRIKAELNQLLDIGLVLDNTGSLSPSEDLESAILRVLHASYDLRIELQGAALDQAEELIMLFDSTEIVNALKSSVCAVNKKKFEEYAEKYKEYVEHVQDVSKLLHHVSHTKALQVFSMNTEACVKLFGPQILIACQCVYQHPTCEIANENLEVFLDVWYSLCGDVVSLTKEIRKECQERMREKSVYMSLPRPGKHGTTSKHLKPVKLDAEEQAKIAKVGLEMKLLTSEIDAETDKWTCGENDIVRGSRNMSRMAFSMYQFTRGEGELKTTQDLFTRAEFFAEEANKMYKLVRQFSYQVPCGKHKGELLELLDEVPTFVQQLQFTVKNSTVGKAATFTKVDNVIQETKKLMNVIAKVVAISFLCAAKFNIDLQNLTRRSNPMPLCESDDKDISQYKGVVTSDFSINHDEPNASESNGTF